MSDEQTLNVLRKAEVADTQKELANEVGLSVGKVNYILKELVKKGLIKMENFAGAKSKKKYRYLLTPKGIQEKMTLTERFIRRKKHEYEELQLELENYHKQNFSGK